MGSASDTGIIYIRGKACYYPEKFCFQVRGVKLLLLYFINSVNVEPFGHMIAELEFTYFGTEP